ncbi:MAG: signal peptidase I [Planctomycetia bacterium]|nr:signal peptidase I [Planctomycetia bacterium]
MSREQPRSERAGRRVVAPGDPRDKPRESDTVRSPLASGRETVESIVVAFTLALLFRAFEAEAFVIPTGSMAPTLMGRHKDLVCAACGRDFRVGSSAEEDDQSQSLRIEQARLERELAGLRAGRDAAPPEVREADRRRAELLESERGPLAQLRLRLAGKMVAAARCPNCGHVMRLVEGEGPAVRYDPRFPSFTGDRILVDKFAYGLSEPSRWDVVVFKYPEEAKTNYIKRLVGLPGETVSISAGDIWTSRDGAEPRIARKPPDRLRAMLQCVHDSRFVAPALRRAGWPLAWTDWRGPGAEGPGWRTADDGRSFALSGGVATLRYRHLLPAPEDWAALEQGEPIAGRARPRLIDDFQPYNAIATRPHWVGDLALACTLETRGPGGTLTLDLVEAGRSHRCTIDLVDGAARLAWPGAAGAEPRAKTPVRGRGSWRILFANVDDELTLFVDGRPVAFDRPTLWDRPIDDAEASLPDDRPAEPGGIDPGDLAPAGITAAGADVRVADLQVLRDVYYIGALDVGTRPGELVERERLEFPLEAGQFFVLGDNSAASKDSRMWLTGHHVDRDLLIGRALVIFWPHAVPANWSVPVKIGGIELRLPSWPNFARMGFVR